MRRFYLFLFCVSTTLTVLSQPRISNIADIVDEEAANHDFSGIVLVANQGQVVMEKPVGYANKDEDTRIGSASKFRITSMTMSFTTVIIMQLVQEGSLSLDQNIKKLLPSVPLAYGDKITVEDCLLHTSGMPNEDDEAYSKKRTPMEVLGMYAGKKKGWGKQGAFHYSNLDFIVLGLVIESITNDPWYVNVENRILKPLKMNDTGFLDFDNLPDGLVLGYVTDQKGDLVLEPDYHIENFFAAGSMYSTARDLLRFDQGLYKDVLLNKESKQIMYASHSELGYVSFGHWVYKYPFLPYQPTLVERRGGILGFTGVFIRFIDDNYTLIILSNNDQFNPDTYADTESMKERIIMHMGQQ